MALISLDELTGNEEDAKHYVNTTQICYFGPKRGENDKTIIKMSDGSEIFSNKSSIRVRIALLSGDRNMAG